MNDPMSLEACASVQEYGLSSLGIEMSLLSHLL